MLPKPRLGRGESRGHGGFRYLQGRRNLAVAVTVVVPEHDDCRLFGWKSAERRMQVAPLRHLRGITAGGRPAQATD